MNGKYTLSYLKNCEEFQSVMDTKLSNDSDIHFIIIYCIGKEVLYLCLNKCFHMNNECIRISTTTKIT